MQELRKSPWGCPVTDGNGGGKKTLDSTLRRPYLFGKCQWLWVSDRYLKEKARGGGNAMRVSKVSVFRGLNGGLLYRSSLASPPEPRSRSSSRALLLSCV
jgi:hypothetical protein